MATNLHTFTKCFKQWINETNARIGKLGASQLNLGGDDCVFEFARVSEDLLQELELEEDLDALHEGYGYRVIEARCLGWMGRVSDTLLKINHLSRA